jgi:hypothetical protein
MDEKTLLLFVRRHDLSLHNAYKSCEGNIIYLKFREHLVRDLVLAHKMKTEMHGVTRGQLSSSEIQLNQPEAKHVLHWLDKEKEHCSCAEHQNPTLTVTHCNEYDTKDTWLSKHFSSPRFINDISAPYLVGIPLLSSFNHGFRAIQVLS